MQRSFNRAGGAAPQDIYTRVTNRILADLAKGVTLWIRPWDAGNTEGRIVRPLHHNGEKYNGVNVLLLWSAAHPDAADRSFFETERYYSTLTEHRDSAP